MSLNEPSDRSHIISDMGRQFSDITILMHEAIAKSVGLTGTDHKYLGFILQHGTVTAGELSKITGLTTGAVTGLIDRLEKKELVKRVFDKGDRRKILIEPINENVSNLLGGIFGELQMKMLKLLGTFDDNELQIIEKYLHSAMQLMKEITQSLKS